MSSSAAEASCEHVLGSLVPGCDRPALAAELRGIATTLPARAAELAELVAAALDDQIDEMIPWDTAAAVLTEALRELAEIEGGGEVDEDAIDVHRHSVRSLAPLDLGMDDPADVAEAEAAESEADASVSEDGSAEETEEEADEDASEDDEAAEEDDEQASETDADQAEDDAVHESVEEASEDATGVAAEPAPDAGVPMELQDRAEPDAVDRPSPEIVTVFRHEARDLLSTCETALLELENEPGDANAIGEIFRALHSFKGNCGFMGYRTMEHLAHRAESLLVLVKEGRRPVNEPTISALMYAVDALGAALDDTSDDPHIPGLPALLAQLDRHIDAKEAPKSAAPAKAPEAVIDLDTPTPSTIVAAPEPVVAAVATPAAAPTPAPKPAVAKPAVPKAAAPKPVAVPKPVAESKPIAAAPKPAAAPKLTAPAKLALAPPPTELPKDEAPMTDNDAAPRAVELPRAAEGADAEAATRNKGARGADSTLRVDVAKVEALLDLMGELIIAGTAVRHLPITGPEAEAFARASAQLDRVVRSLQDVSMSLRMVPVGPTFKRMVRLVRDVSQRLGKPVELVMDGEETEIDKSVAELIADPLVHLVRNAIDHGLETPDDRAKAGKHRSGRIRISGAQVGGEVWIRVEDDGRGLDRNKIIDRAIQRGLVDPAVAPSLPDHDVYAFIFEPGFSTAAAVTDVSGRGVGMDVVAKNVAQVKGRIDIRSTAGQGAAFTLRIPLTLAIIEGMLLRVGMDSFTVPLLNIRESVVIQAKDVTTLSSGQELVRIRGELLPVLRIHRLFDIPPETEALHEGIILVVEDGATPLCLFVDQLVGQRQTVIKAVSGFLGNVRGIAGCTVLGDGRISLVLDVGALIQRASIAA